MSDRIPWDALVGEMLRRRIFLEQIDPEVYPMPGFGVRATDDDLAEATTRLGHPLDEHHAAILREVDGWRSAFFHGDVLGSREMGGGPRWQAAWMMLRGYYEDGPATDFPPRTSIYPIHASETSVCVVDMAGPVTDGGHPVYRLDGSVVAAWPNAYQYWLAGIAMLDRLTARIQDRRRAQQVESHGARGPEAGDRSQGWAR